MKKIFVLLVLVILISGCTTTNKTVDKNLDTSNQTGTLQEKIKALETELEQMKLLVDNSKYEKDVFPILSNLSLDFVRAHTDGNIEEIKKLVSSEIKISEKEDTIFGITSIDNTELEWILHNKNDSERYQDMVIQGYGFDSNKNVFVIHIREFYKDSNGNISIPPTFLNLYFKKIDNTWKIINFEFDV